MVRAGLAEVYKGEPPYGLDLTPYWQAEKKAKEVKRKMRSQGDKYISPKEWCRMKRSK
jgi:micrococcal nuclease